MSELQTIIRNKIVNKFGGVVKFSNEIGVRQATVSDWLNLKKGVTTTTLFKILEPLGFGINDIVGQKFTQVDTVYVNGRAISKGGVYKGRKVDMCLGIASGSYQALAFKNDNGEMEIRIV